MKTKTGKGTENKTDIESILKELTGDGIKGCYLLYGEDEYTRRKAEERLKRVVVDEASEMMNLSVFSDVKTTAGQIIEAAETMPFLATEDLYWQRTAVFSLRERKRRQSCWQNIYRRYRIRPAWSFPRRLRIKE